METSLCFEINKNALTLENFILNCKSCELSEIEIDSKNLIKTIVIYGSVNKFMTKQNLLDSFEEFRNSMIEQLYIFVGEKKNKEVLLKSSEAQEVIGDRIITEIYKRLFIKDDSLFVEYDYGEDFEPINYEKINEDIEIFSANEIFEIIMGIEE